MILRLRSGAGIQEAGVQSWLWGTRANFLTSTPRLPMCSEEANNTFSYLFRTGCGSDCLAKCTIDLSTATVMLRESCLELQRGFGGGEGYRNTNAQQSNRPPDFHFKIIDGG